MDTNKMIIISVGGSLIVPEEIDISWISGFKKIADKYISKGYKLIIITGGEKLPENTRMQQKK